MTQSSLFTPLLGHELPQIQGKPTKKRVRRAKRNASKKDA